MNAVDTNSLIYYMDRTNPQKALIAGQLLLKELDLVLPWQVLCEIGNCLRKLEQRGLPRADGRAILRTFEDEFTILLPGLPSLELALDLQERFSLSFWDANLVAACLTAGVETLFSEDITGYRNIDGLKLVNPFATVYWFARNQRDSHSGKCPAVWTFPLWLSQHANQ